MIGAGATLPGAVDCGGGAGVSVVVVGPSAIVNFVASLSCTPGSNGLRLDSAPVPSVAAVAAGGSLV